MLKNYIGILSAIENKENLRRLAAHRAVAHYTVLKRSKGFFFGRS